MPRSRIQHGRREHRCSRPPPYPASRITRGDSSPVVRGRPLNSKWSIRKTATRPAVELGGLVPSQVHLNLSTLWSLVVREGQHARFQSRTGVVFDWKSLGFDVATSLYRSMNHPDHCKRRLVLEGRVISPLEVLILAAIRHDGSPKQSNRGRLVNRRDAEARRTCVSGQTPRWCLVPIFGRLR